MEFLKRHYEKIILCLVLLGLAAAAIWMRRTIQSVQDSIPAVSAAPSAAPRVRGRPGAAAASTLPPLDLSAEKATLAQVTNAPTITLAGAHNLFNPVTWHRKSDGTLVKIVKSGPEALVVTNITKLYTVIAFDHPSGSGSGVYVMDILQHSDPQRHKPPTPEYAKKDEKMKSGLYIIRDIKGDPDNPTELDVELPARAETVAVTKDKPFEWVDSCIADLRYEPDSKNFKVHVNDNITLTGEQYKVVEITTNAVRIQFNRTTKVTEIKWK